MRSCRKLVLFSLLKPVEYLPFFFSGMIRTFLFEPVFQLLVWFHASDSLKNSFALKTMTLPTPPFPLVVFLATAFPFLILVFKKREAKVLLGYFLFATAADLTLLAGIYLLTFFVKTGNLADAFFFVAGLGFAGILLAGRAAGLLLSVITVKIRKRIKAGNPSNQELK